MAISRTATLGEWCTSSDFPWYLPGSNVAVALIRQTTDSAHRAQLRSLLEYCREQVRRDVDLSTLLAHVAGVQLVDDLAFERAMEDGYRAWITSGGSRGRQVFRRRFPLGVIRISSPCYSDDRRLALVLKEEHHAPMWGVAQICLLKRVGDTWTVVRTQRIWRS